MIGAFQPAEASSLMDGEAYLWSGGFSELKPADQHVVALLVVKGGAVVGAIDDLLARLKRTSFIALLREKYTDRIIALAACKVPAARYRLKNFNAAGVSIVGFEVASELGYVVVAPDMRGRKLSGVIVNAITARITEPTFATTGSATMRNNLERSGFTFIGHEWKGKRGMLSLWTIVPAITDNVG